MFAAKPLIQLFSSYLLYAFYASNAFIVCIFLLQGKYGTGWIEDILLFMPGGVFLTLLIPALLFRRQFFVRQLIIIAFFVCFFTYFYLGFNIPSFATPEKHPVGMLRVMSANLGGINSNSKPLKEQIDNYMPDIVTFQETDQHKIRKVLPSSWNIHCVDHMCMASHYTIQYEKKLSRREFKLWGSYAVLYTVNINGTFVRVVNVHMETPRKGFETLLASLRKFNLHGMKNNINQRFNEARNIIGLTIEDSPVLLMGDFNMPVNSRMYREYYSEFSNAFSDNGWGFGDTKYTRYHGIRIDHVLMNHHLSSSNAWTAEDIGGDHRPLFADIYFTDLP